MNDYLTIIGAGLAGSEAAWQAAELGVDVRLFEMRPEVQTAVHQTGDFAELVCSNSLRSTDLTRGPGLLKQEMRRLDSLVVRCADATAVPAGAALAVDRRAFSRTITAVLEAHPRITIEREEVSVIPDETPCIVATGPLTSESLSAPIRDLMLSLTGNCEFLYFCDAVSPIVDAHTIDFAKVFRASRYDKGDEAAYLNCPMGEDEYDSFREELLGAGKVELRDFEEKHFFEGCLPIEELAARGRDTLRFGPMKPVGLLNPDTGERSFAVVQLRQENNAKSLYNLVGFQTRLLWPEQERVFRMIPGLEKADFVRLGVIHRNTYINSPRVLLPTCELKERPGLFFAGQITGVEGYIESAACGLVAGINAARRVRGDEPTVFPQETAIGALIRYITTSDPESFQPMNINFGLLPPLENPTKDRKRNRQAMAERALSRLKTLYVRST